MRLNIAAIIMISIILVFSQSQTLQLVTIEGDVSSGAVESVESDVEGWISSSFNEIFGVEEDNSNITTPHTKQNNDQPPPIETWLLDPPEETADSHAIPRIINKIYFQKGSGYPPSESMPAGLIAAHKSWADMNPGYDIRYFDLEQARRYLQQHFHAVFLRAFDCLPAFASKSDLFRMTLLYREGGWHTDWKQVCLEQYVLQNITEAADFYADYDLWESGDYFKHKCVQNAFIGSKPRHPNIAKMLEMQLINIQTSRYSGAALDPVGTCCFGRAIHVSEEERNSQRFSQVAGKFLNDPEHGGAFQFSGRTIVKHKCDDCGQNQDWGKLGNNYLDMYKRRQFYCEDAASLFHT